MQSYSVNVKEINWLYRGASEAEVLVEIEGKILWTFCHPCNFSHGENVRVRFLFIEEEIPEYNFWNENHGEKRELEPSESEKLRYYCYGQITSVQPALVDCGTIEFNFGDWINDDRTIGHFVYFVIGRLDIQRI